MHNRFYSRSPSPGVPWWVGDSRKVSEASFKDHHSPEW